MTPLPFDYCRCKPSDPDDKCRQCKRWADHPEQTWGHRTAYVVTRDSKDVACIHMPTTHQEAE